MAQCVFGTLGAQVVSLSWISLDRKLEADRHYLRYDLFCPLSHPITHLKYGAGTHS